MLSPGDARNLAPRVTRAAAGRRSGTTPSSRGRSSIDVLLPALPSAERQMRIGMMT
jgi:hypothetical protein